MNREAFDAWIGNGIHFLDGGTGSWLQEKGMPSGICVEKWVCDNKEVLIDLQKQYIQAGSEAVYASSFSANKIKLKEYGLEQEVLSINRDAVQISKEAAGEKALVGGDMTMTGQQLEPLGTVTLDELIEAYKEQAAALEAAGADFLIIETMMSLQETRAAVIAAQEVTELPIMATLSFGEDGRTLYGTDAKTAATVLGRMNLSAVGVNCSAGPDKMVSVVQDMRQVTHLPIIVKPNAGLPKMGADGRTEYSMEADQFAQHMGKLVEAGASILGGCCGTNPDYIKKTKRMVEASRMPSLPDKESIPVCITSERQRLEWKQDCTMGIIDTTQEELAEDFADGIYDTMYDLIDEFDDETDAICLNLDGVQADLEKAVGDIIRELTSYTTIPVVFKSNHKDVLAAALRCYPGTAGVMTELDEEEIRQLLNRYGAVWLEDC